MTKLTWDQVGPLDGSKPFFHTDANPAAPAVRGDRAFFGLARWHGQQTDGSVTNGSWLQSFATALSTVTEWDYFEDQARVVSVSDFGTAISGASRTTGNTPAIGLAGVAVASAANGHPAWGAYVDAVRAVSGAGNATAAEFQAAQLVGVGAWNTGVPFGRKGRSPVKIKTVGEVVTIRAGAGSDAAVFTRSYASDAIIEGGQNGAASYTFINIPFDALMRESTPDDRTPPKMDQGFGAFARLPYDIGISWYSLMPSGAVGSGTQEEVFRIGAKISDPAIQMSLIADDTGLILQERDGTASNLFRVDYITAAASWPVMIPGAATLAGFGVRGAGPNNNLGLYPQGAGIIYVPVANVPAHADQAAAVTAGVPVGGFFYNSTVGALDQRRA